MSAVCLNLKCKILIINNLYNTVKILFLLNASMMRSNLGSKLRYQLNFQIIRKKKLKKYVLFFNLSQAQVYGINIFNAVVIIRSTVAAGFGLNVPFIRFAKIAEMDKARCPKSRASP